jgi:antitoxin component of MazEF toxin-antitoxin module
MIYQGVFSMTTRIMRVGNALTVEIPEELVARAALPVGEPVEWVANEGGGIALVKKSDAASATRRKRMTLKELLEGLPEDAQMEEIDWGPPRGAEVW